MVIYDTVRDIDIAREMLKQGLAWYYKEYENILTDEEKGALLTSLAPLFLLHFKGRVPCKAGYRDSRHPFQGRRCAQCRLVPDERSIS